MASKKKQNSLIYDGELLQNIIIVSPAAVDAAMKFIKSYSVVTWYGEPNKIDWSPLKSRRVLIWPDHCGDGMATAASVFANIAFVASELKIIDTREDDLPSGFNAVTCGFTWDEFVAWAKPRALKIDMPTEPPAEDERIANPGPDTVNNIVVAGDDAIKDLTFQVSTNVAANIERCGLIASKAGRPYKNIMNVTRILASDFSQRIWFDEFHDCILTDIEGKPEKWSDKHMYNVTIMMQANYGLHEIGHQTVQNGIESFAFQNTRNEPKDWFESLKWDDTERVSTFFSSYMGAEDNEYTRAVSRNFWISMIARTYKPGCKSDSMVILEGLQGSRKSSALEAIAGKWFSETNVSPTDKDFYLIMHGCLLIEIAELDSFSRAETNTIKKVVSCHTDRYRSPYGRVVKDHPRRCIFAGTTNKDDYLKDETGARRFWPVLTDKINVDAIRRDREQLFAEAVFLFKSGVKWHSVPSEQAKEEQMKRFEQDVWTEYVINHALGQREVTVKDILTGALKFDANKIDQRCQNRVSKILQANGFKRLICRRGESVVRVYVNPTWYDSAPKKQEITHKYTNHAPKQ